MNKKKATFRLIEAELYAYPKTKEELEQMREDILSMQAVAHEGVRVNVSGAHPKVHLSFTAHRRRRLSQYETKRFRCHWAVAWLRYACRSWVGTGAW